MKTGFNKLKNKILLLFFILLSQILILVITSLITPDVYSKSYFAELAIKEQLLKDTMDCPRRIITVGGSAVAFGVESSMIQEEFPNYEIINFGLYAGLGTKIMMDIISNNAKEGDVLILIPEQNKQSLSLYFNAEYFLMTASSKRSLLKYVKPTEYEDLIFALPFHVLQKIKLLYNISDIQNNDIYCVDSFDENGDIKSDLQQDNIMVNKYDKQNIISFERDYPDKEAVRYFNDFAHKLTKKGVQVFYVFCPMNILAVKDDNYIIKQYQNYIKENLDFAIINDINDCVLDSSLFYDTNFHTNNRGKTIYTYNLIKALKANLQDTSKTNDLSYYINKINIIEHTKKIELLNKTDYSNISLAQAERIFILKKIDDKYHITDLTEEGKSKERIQIVDFIDDIPVSVIEKDCFYNNTNIKEVEVGKNIVLIEDFAFENAKNLKYIIMNNNNTHNCFVGENLLYGTNAKIAVSKEAYNQYKLSYWWSKYSEKIVVKSP